MLHTLQCNATYTLYYTRHPFYFFKGLTLPSLLYLTPGFPSPAVLWYPLSPTDDWGGLTGEVQDNDLLGQVYVRGHLTDYPMIWWPNQLVGRLKYWWSIISPGEKRQWIVTHPWAARGPLGLVGPVVVVAPAEGLEPAGVQVSWCHHRFLDRHLHQPPPLLHPRVTS